MRRRYGVLALVTFALLAATGCGTADEEPASGQDTTTIESTATAEEPATTGVSTTTTTSPTTTTEDPLAVGTWGRERTDDACVLVPIGALNGFYGAFETYPPSPGEGQATPEDPLTNCGGIATGYHLEAFSKQKLEQSREGFDSLGDDPIARDVSAAIDRQLAAPDLGCITGERSSLQWGENLYGDVVASGLIDDGAGYGQLHRPDISRYSEDSGVGGFLRHGDAIGAFQFWYHDVCAYFLFVFDSESDDLTQFEPLVTEIKNLIDAPPPAGTSSYGTEFDD